jgi:hypothetical protein
MSRWLVLAVFSIAPAMVGCASSSVSVRPGLANAPRLGSTGLADERITDVVSNGDDGCIRHAEHGALRNRLPPCPGAGRPVFATEWPVARAPGSESLVLPWVRHFYSPWPCVTPAPSDSKTVAWTVAPAPTASCSSP